MVASYEQRLNYFAQGKRLLRLARPIRNRADAFCDACGSAQPRSLYALADLETERYFFVGDTCLKELAKRGVIQRRFGRESGQQAYETEMNLRSSQEAAKATEVGNNRTGSEAAATKPIPEDDKDRAAMSAEQEHQLPIVLIFETAEYYQVFVSIFSAKCGTYCSATAREIRYEEVWGTGGENGLMLEKTKRERVDAAMLCLTRAWEDAHSQLTSQESVLPQNSETGDIGMMPITLVRAVPMLASILPKGM